MSRACFKGETVLSTHAHVLLGGQSRVSAERVGWLICWLLLTAICAHGQNVSSLMVWNGDELVAALSDPLGPTEVIIATDSLVITEDNFLGYQVPIVLRRNITLTGKRERYPYVDTSQTFNFTSPGKFLLYNYITFTIQYVVMSPDFYNSVIASAVPPLVGPMPNSEGSMLIGRHAAFVNSWCYPFYPEYMGRAYLAFQFRPDWIPGVNTYNLTSSVPPELRNGSDTCSNSSTAALLERCWAHVAYSEDGALYAEMNYNRIDGGKPTVYVVHVTDSYMLCEHVMDDECIAKYGALRCVILSMQLPEMMSGLLGDTPAAAPLPPAASGGSGAQTPATPPGIPAGSGSGTGSTGEHKGAGHVVPAALGVVGGVLLVAVLGIIAVRLRQRASNEKRHRWGSDKEGNTMDSPELSPSHMTLAVLGAPPPTCEGGGTGMTDSLTASATVGASTTGNSRATGTPATASSNAAAATALDEAAMAAAVAAAGAVAAAALVPGGEHEADATDETPLVTNEQQQVVVTPLTPFRPDLNLHPGVAAEVTLLPVTRGKGSFGAVCEGLYGGQRVAVKILRDVVGVVPNEVLEDALETFEREVSILGRCDHPNVVRLLAACVQPPRVLLVMELMETSLGRLVYGRPGQLLPLPQVLHIATEIARALEYLHPTIVHRDLKPDNVLISGLDSPRPLVKVSDFGLSRLRSTVMTTANPGAGTPAYLPPECFDTDATVITHHVDMYSWAVLVWAMLTGEQPWKGFSIVAIAYQVVLLDQRPPLADVVSSGRCPPRLQQLLAGCWSREAARRPAAAEVVKEMMLLAQSLQHD